MIREGLTTGRCRYRIHDSMLVLQIEMKSGGGYPGPPPSYWWRDAQIEDLTEFRHSSAPKKRPWWAAVFGVQQGGNHV